MTAYGPTREDRLRGVIGAAVMGSLLGWAVLAGLNVSVTRATAPALKLFGVLPDPPPPPPEPKPRTQPRTQKSEGKAAPPNLRSRATPVVAPTPVIRLPAPPPVVAAPIPFQGNQASQGNADIAGPGTGAGGVGNGTGSGGRGNGEGGGVAAREVQVAGWIKQSYYPKAAVLEGASGLVAVSFWVETNGRATDCRIDRSSGSRVLDLGTCDLIERRYRFRPARDAAGQPVRILLHEEHDWHLERDPDLDERR